MAENMEWGVRRGLAQVLPSQQDQMYQVAMLKQRAKDSAAAKAKMFADDFEYNNAMNGHDNPLVKNYATKAIGEIGSFIRQNPDWETNPMARAQYKTMVHNLKDNPDLNRGLSSDQSYNAWQKYQNDPKNADIVNTPEFQRVNQEWDNYLKFGNQHGEEATKTQGKRAFAFVPPEETQDYTEYLRKIAGDTEFDGHNTKYSGYQIINKQNVSSSSRQRAVQLALSSPMKKWIQKDYEKRGGVKALGSIEEFTRTIMDPFFKGDAYNYAMIPEYATGGGGGGAQTQQPTDWWRQDTERAFKASANNVTTPVTASQNGVAEIMRGPDGTYNLSGSELWNPKTGNFITVPNLVTKNATSSGSRIIYTGDPKDPQKGKFKISTKVRMPMEQAKSYFGQSIDLYQWYNPADWGGNWGTTDEKDPTFKVVKDDTGNDVVEFETWKAFDNSGTHAGAYNYGNGGSKQKTADVTMSQRVGTDPATGKDWYMDENGNAIRPVE